MNLNQIQFMIPSFNPSLSSSRKEKYQNYNSSELKSTSAHQDQPFDFSKKLFEVDSVRPAQSAELLPFPQDFWESLYNQQVGNYKNLINKHNMLQQSIKLHKQALNLRNIQHLQSEQQISTVQRRIKNLTKKSQQKQKKIKQISIKCQQIKQSIDNISIRIKKEQKIIQEEEKHIKQIENKKKHLKEDTKKLEKQLQEIIKKQDQYDELVQENNYLLEERNQMKNEATFAKLKINNDLEEQENIFKKMKQLQKIIKFKEKNNRELGKKLIEIRRTNPNVQAMLQELSKTQMMNDRHKVSKLEEIVNNIKDMDRQFGKLQQQIYEISGKIQITKDKMGEKLSSLESLRSKHENEMKREQQIQRSRQGQRSPYSHQNVNKNYQLHQNIGKLNNSPQIVVIDSSTTSNINLNPNQANIHKKKKPIGYHIIQSQENEQFVYPRPTLKNYTAEHSVQNQPQIRIEDDNNIYNQSSQNEKTNSYPIKITYSERQNRSDNNSGKNPSHKSNRDRERDRDRSRQGQGQVSEIEGEGNEYQQLKYSESFKNLLQRYKNVIENTHFRH